MEYEDLYNKFDGFYKIGEDSVNFLGYNKNVRIEFEVEERLRKG